MYGGQKLLPSLQELALDPSFPQEVLLVLSFPQEELTFVLSRSHEEVELPLLPGLSIAEKLPLPASPSLLQVAGERLKSRPLRKSILELSELLLYAVLHLYRLSSSLSDNEG